MSGRSCTSGHQGPTATANAEAWGLCACGEGSDDDDGWEVPLFRVDGALLCAGCYEDTASE